MPPLEVRFNVEPAHWGVLLPAVGVGKALTVTELMAGVELMQPNASVPKTEYEVVVTGLTLFEPLEYV